MDNKILFLYIICTSLISLLFLGMKLLDHECPVQMITFPISTLLTSYLSPLPAERPQSEHRELEVERVACTVSLSLPFTHDRSVSEGREVRQDTTRPILILLCSLLVVSCLPGLLLCSRRSPWEPLLPPPTHSVLTPLVSEGGGNRRE